MSIKNDKVIFGLTHTQWSPTDMENKFQTGFVNAIYHLVEQKMGLLFANH